MLGGVVSIELELSFLFSVCFFCFLMIRVKTIIKPRARANSTISTIITGAMSLSFCSVDIILFSEFSSLVILRL